MVGPHPERSEGSEYTPQIVFGDYYFKRNNDVIYINYVIIMT